MAVQSTARAGRKICGYPTRNGSPCQQQIPLDLAACGQHLESYLADQARQRVENARSRGQVRTLEEIHGAVRYGKPHLREMSDYDRFSETMRLTTNLDSDLHEPVYRSVESLLDEVDLRVPSKVLDKMPGLMRTFHHHLIDNGVEIQRISTRWFFGMHRRTPFGNRQIDDERIHVVTILDESLDGYETSVDPFTSILCPVKDESVPVEQELGDWATRLLEIPLITTPDFYRDDTGHIWFDDAQRRRIEL